MTQIRYSLRQENCEICTLSEDECLAGDARCQQEVVTEVMDIDKITFEINPHTREILAILLCGSASAEPVRISPLLLKNIANTETGHVLLSRRNERGAKIYEESVKHREEFVCEFAPVIRK